MFFCSYLTQKVCTCINIRKIRTSFMCNMRETEKVKGGVGYKDEKSLASLGSSFSLHCLTLSSIRSLYHLQPTLIFDNRFFFRKRKPFSPLVWSKNLYEITEYIRKWWANNIRHRETNYYDCIEFQWIYKNVKLRFLWSLCKKFLRNDVQC